jgi:general secretion pathway protein D
MYVGQRVPYLRSSNITNDGRIVNTYDFQNVGVTLQVFPRITESGYIGLDVNQTSSEVMANAAAGAPPTISTREAQTSVMVKHGETVVIGGIIRENKTDQIKKIPILGDIPLIGALFRRTETTTAKSELLVFITPYIIRNDTDAVTITQFEQQNSEDIRDSIIKPKPVPLSSSVNGESVENMAAGESAPVEDRSQK